MIDKLRLPDDLGKAIASYREQNKLSAVAVANKAGRMHQLRSESFT